jgi:hypothetical protein
MMPASVRVGPFAAFEVFSGEKPKFVNKARGEIPTKGVWVSLQHNATHIISIPEIGRLAAILRPMTAERQFLTEMRSEPGHFLTCETQAEGCGRQPHEDSAIRQIVPKQGRFWPVLHADRHYCSIVTRYLSRPLRGRYGARTVKASRAAMAV